MSRLQAAIAATRFGMGARPGDIAAATADPRGWLNTQIKANAVLIPQGDLLSAKDVLEARYGPASRAVSRKPSKRETLFQKIRMDAADGLMDEISTRLRFSISTPDTFADRWMRFWSNHFTVAVRNATMVGLVGPFEREAIRPHVFGSFAGLLRAASLHQGMLIYLDAAQSIGPSTDAAQQRDAGLNENLAREILELHTLGVGSGYTQGDIIEFAKALTGWTVVGLPVTRMVTAAGNNNRGVQGRQQQAAADLGDSTFVSALHEPGGRTVLGKRYSGDGKGQAAAILNDLALHPATARHIATKLARHFVSDQPPASAIAKLETAFNYAQGDLAALARAVVNLDEAWAAPQKKLKTPEELLVSIARAASGRAPLEGLRRIYSSLSQRPFAASSPAGWSDDAEAWAGADAVMKRLAWANVVSRGMARGASPSKVLDWALGDLASARTRQAVERAESAEQGFTLAIMSPEFQRR